MCEDNADAVSPKPAPVTADALLSNGSAGVYVFGLDRRDRQ